MLALGLPVVVGLFAGLLVGGRLRYWHTTTFDFGLVACGALLLQLTIFDPPLDGLDAIIRFGPALYVASMLAIAAVLVRNARVCSGAPRSLALGVAALGVLLNCAVVTANGGYMPRAAVDGWPEVTPPGDAGRLVNVAPIGPDTRLVILGDILPEPDWIPYRNMLSVGDLVLAGALGSWAFLVTIGGPNRLRAG